MNGTRIGLIDACFLGFVALTAGISALGFLMLRRLDRFNDTTLASLGCED